MIFKNCIFNSITWKNCKFSKIPYFDEQCKISQFVNIDNRSIKNLNAEPLEYSNLISFFSKSGAYLEAQELHKKFLWAKKTKTSSFGFKVLVYLYYGLNQCGNSIIQPIIIWLLISVAVCLIYCHHNLCDPINQTFLTMIPLLATVEKPAISSLPSCIQILIYCLMISSYILLFLIALTIRKKLKLRE